MPTPTAPPRPPGVSGRSLSTLVALAAALAAAFVLAPRVLAANGSGDVVDQRHLATAFRSAFVEYWRSGHRDFSAGLTEVVDFWFRYHVAKAVIAGTLLVVLAALGVILWKAFLRAGALGAGRQAALASAGVIATMLALFSLAAVMANIQGALAPFASLLPMLTDGPADPDLADTLGQVQRRLADSPSAGLPTAPARDAMVSGFAQYHWAMAGIAAVVGVFLMGMSAVLWARFATAASSERRTRRTLGSFGVLSAGLSLIVLVIAAANARTALDPTPALLAALEGSW